MVKTPPCADRIVRDRVGRVVICNKDSNPVVSGMGIRRMIAGGVKVHNDVLEEQGRQLNKRFFTFHEKKKALYHFKMGANHRLLHCQGKTTSPNGSVMHFHEKMAHKWRTEEDAVMVGTNTAQYDNPRLNARDWQGKNPVRIVIDKHLRLDRELFFI